MAKKKHDSFGKLLGKELTAFGKDFVKEGKEWGKATHNELHGKSVKGKGKNRS